MLFHRRKWVLPLLAVLISFGGGPASWAQVFAHVEKAAATEHCATQPGQSHQDQGATHDGKSGCCEKGACTCAPSIASCGAAVPLSGVVVLPPADFSLIPDRAEPVGQLLRPPRS